jgi:hypothetical protein
MRFWERIRAFVGRKHAWTLMIPNDGSDLFFRCEVCGRDFHGPRVREAFITARPPVVEPCKG